MKYRLSELANIRNGKKPKTKKLNAKYEIYGSNGIIGYTDKSNSGKNTIVIGRVGANAGSVLFSENESWVSDNAIIVTPKDDSIAYYLYYLLKKSSLNKFVSGSAQPLINQSILNSIHLRLIGKESQLKVAQFLRKLDSKIELNNQIISNLEELASTLFKRWFVEFEFPDKNGNPYKSSGGKMIDSELGEIPESFSVENFGSHIKYISKGTTPTKKDLLSSKSIKNVKYLKVKDIPSVGMINYKNLEEIPEDVHEKQLKRSALKKGDIILSIAGTIGRVNIISSETELNTNQAVSFIRLNEERFQYYYLQLLKSKYYQQILQKKIVQAVQANLSLSEIKKMKIVVPPKEVISSFTIVIDNLYSNIISTDREKNNLEELRDLLLPKLLSGEIELPEDEEV
ncbi:restriction endonuclease subunit S [Enterococcus faecium]|uniref:restriction endonuclease subunit S n=1 Tax=Enterococcus faecalis TaxID=1351 RepID=UPI0012E29861|nr:restriction endonuclease subunit S [Enterococcus faecalis]MDO7879426.1 restriction endonuclease subunit S [Enterococcus mundtii]MUO25229.1 hypothetical protein [Enterococcus faecalis]